jgi:hypothetical protein
MRAITWISLFDDGLHLLPHISRTGGPVQEVEQDFTKYSLPFRETYVKAYMVKLIYLAQLRKEGSFLLL